MREQDKPPLGANTAIRPHVVRAPKHGWLAVLFLDNLQGCFGHFYRRHFLPCRGEDDCPKKRHEVRLDWRGYAAAFWRPPQESNTLWTPCIWECTSLTAALLGEDGIRGRTFYFGRSADPKAKDEILVKACNLSDGVKVPRPFPLRPILDRVFGESDYRLGSPNPIDAIPTIEPFDLNQPASDADDGAPLDEADAAAMAKLRALRDEKGTHND